MTIIFTKFKYYIERKKNDNITTFIIYLLSPNNSSLKFLTNFFTKSKGSSLFEKRFLISFCGTLASNFIQRYNDERKQYWYLFQKSMLDEKMAKQFGTLLYEQFFELYFIMSTKISKRKLYNIVLLNPELYIDKIMEKINLGLEMPDLKRVRAQLNLYAVSLYPIIINNHNEIGFKQRLELIPMLIQLTQTLNIYNCEICMAQLFTIKSILFLEFPLMDCSSLLNSDSVYLSEHEKEFCRQSIELEEFPLLFINCCQNIIESNNEELFKNISNTNFLSYILTSIFFRSKPEISMVVIDKIFTFDRFDKDFKVMEIILNSCVLVCKFLIILKHFNLKNLFKIYPEYTFKKIFSFISAKIQAWIRENKGKNFSENSKNELLDSLEILKVLCRAKYDILGAYQNEILMLFEEICQLDIGSNFEIFPKILCTLFHNLKYTKLLFEPETLEPELALFKVIISQLN